jgi:hypothetical protein
MSYCNWRRREDRSPEVLDEPEKSTLTATLAGSDVPRCTLLFVCIRARTCSQTRFLSQRLPSKWQLLHAIDVEPSANLDKGR